MDRWNIVTTLNYLPHDAEAEIVLAKVPQYATAEGQEEDFGHGPRRRHDAQCLHRRRPVDSDEPAHRHHLGGKRVDLRRYRFRLPRHLPQQMRRTRTRQRGRVLSALLRRRIAGKRGKGSGRSERESPTSPMKPENPARAFQARRRHGGALARRRTRAGSEFQRRTAGAEGDSRPACPCPPRNLSPARNRHRARHRATPMRCAAPITRTRVHDQFRPPSSEAARRLRGGRTGPRGGHRRPSP